MRVLLSLVFAAAVSLTFLWGSATIFFGESQSTWAEAVRPGLSSTVAAALMKQALDRLETSISLSPVNAAYWRERARLLLKLGNLISDLQGLNSWYQDYLRAVVDSPAWEVPLLELAQLCGARREKNSEDPHACSSLYEAALARDPTYGYVYYKYGDFLFGQASTVNNPAQTGVAKMCKRYGQALRLMSSTLAGSSWYSQSEKKAYADCLSLTEDYETAKGIRPFSPLQWEYLGEGLGRKGQAFWSVSSEQVLKDLTKARKSRDSHLRFARGLAKANLVQGGAEVIEHYLRDHPDDNLGWVEFVRFLVRYPKQFHANQIIAVLNTAKELAKPDFSSALFFADAACQKGDQSLASSFFAEARSLAPSNAAVYSRLGNCLMSQENYQRALKAYEKAVRLDPNSADLRVLLGQALARLGKHEKAVEQLDKALKLNPNHKGAQRALKKMGI